MGQAEPSWLGAVNVDVPRWEAQIGALHPLTFLTFLTLLTFLTFLTFLTCLTLLCTLKPSKRLSNEGG